MTPPGHPEPSRAGGGNPVTAVFEGYTERSGVTPCSPGPAGKAGSKKVGDRV